MDSDRYKNPRYPRHLLAAATVLGYDVSRDSDLAEFAAALVTIGKHGAAAEVLAELNA